MINPFDSDAFRRRSLVSNPAEGLDAFVQVPQSFYQNLTPEQYQAMQQFYRVAYEKAREQVNSSSLSGDLDFGLGI
jgi:hypothetical protein